MASEYLKWKYRDVKPEQPAELTRGEKRKNWWHYHKWHVVTGVVLLAILCSILWNALHQDEPDLQIAYVGSSALPEDTAAAVEAAFEALGEDLNGDGRTDARLVQYVSGSGADPAYGAASEVTLLGDITGCESYFFLLEDPEGFQEAYHALCRLDGDDTVDEVCLSWARCPSLAGQELGGYAEPFFGQTVTGSNQELLSRLYLARRGFWTEKTAPHPEGCEALWERITEGAVS